MEFDDAIIALSTKLETKSISQEDYNEIMGLNDLLCAMGGEHNAACWSEDGIKNAAEWQEISEKASSVLSNLNHLWNGIENQ